MANCERCGKIIPDGVVFCDDCSSGGVTRKVIVTPQATDILHDDHELFSFKGRHSSNIVRIMKIIPIIIGLTSILFGSLFLFPNLIEITIPSNFLPLILTFLGIIILVKISRQSQISSYVFLALIVITLTMGSILVFPEYISLIFAVGITIVCLVLIYTVFRNYRRSKIPIFTLTLILISIGAGIAFPDVILTVLPIALIISGVLIILKF